MFWYVFARNKRRVNKVDFKISKKDNILRQDDIDYIDNKNVKNKKYERW